MSDYISRQAAIKAIRKALYKGVDPLTDSFIEGLENVLESVPSAQSEPLTLRVNHELTKEEYDKLMHDIKDAPIVLLPSAKPDRKTYGWLHEILQDAIDAGIITETQASRLMDRIAEDNT